MSNQMIEQGHLRFVAAMKANDADALMKELGDDVMFMPPNEEPLKGKAATKAWYEGVIAEMETTAMEVSDRRVVVEGDAAMEVGRYTWSLKPKAGGDPFTVRGHFCAGWRQRGGGWEVVWDMWNSMEPAS